MKKSKKIKVRVPAKKIHFVLSADSFIILPTKPSIPSVQQKFCAGKMQLNISAGNMQRKVRPRPQVSGYF